MADRPVLGRAQRDHGHGGLRRVRRELALPGLSGPAGAAFATPGGVLPTALVGLPPGPDLRAPLRIAGGRQPSDARVPRPRLRELPRELPPVHARRESLRVVLYSASYAVEREHGGVTSLTRSTRVLKRIAHELAQPQRRYTEMALRRRISGRVDRNFVWESLSYELEAVGNDWRRDFTVDS